MKKLITILALLIPTFGFGQYVHYHHYPSDSIAEQITKGKIKKKLPLSHQMRLRK